MARALANECSKGDKRVAFFMRKGADCLSKWVGESERQLRLLFDQVSLCNLPLFTVHVYFTCQMFRKQFLLRTQIIIKKIVPIYYPAGYLDLLFDLMKTKASVIKTFCFSKEKENFCFAGLSDAAIHHLF